MVVGISSEECKFRTVLLEHGKALDRGRIRIRAAVNDVSHNGTVHKSLEPIATRKIKSEVVQGVALTGNEQNVVKQRLCQLQGGNASTSFPRFGKRHVEVGEGEHSHNVVDVFAVPRSDVHRKRKDRQ